MLLKTQIIKDFLKYIFKDVLKIKEVNRFLYINLLHPQLIFKRNFINDKSARFKIVLHQLEAKKYDKELILGGRSTEFTKRKT